MLTIGLDVHQSHTNICVLNAHGKLLRQQEVRGGGEAVAAALAKVRAPFQVCYEASTGYGALYERLAPLAEKVVVAHPGKVRLIFQSKKKHDRADAAKLGTLLFLGQVPAVHVPPQAVRSWRGLLEHRRSLVAQGVAVKNQVRALLRHQGIKGLSGKRQWSPSGLKWLAEAAWPTACERLRVEVLLGQLGDLNGRLAQVTAALDAQAGTHPGVGLLQTIPGVGPRTAEAFVAYVDDPHRFGSGTIGAYFGLVPREDSTGNYRHLGHITREGPAAVRQLVVEAGWRGLAQSATLRGVYERILRGDQERRKVAIVALGHWLCRVMLAMLKSGEVFRETAAEAAAG